MKHRNIIKPVVPDPNALKTVVKDCSSITVFSPFYTAGGLFLFESALNENISIKEINFNCRLTKHDWIQGSIDPEALLRMCRKLNSQIRLNIACNDMLHAKAYYSEKMGLVGSANLTSQGFGNGLEFLLMITGNVLDDVKSWFKHNVGPSLRKISIRELRQFVKQNIHEVNREKKKIRKILKRKIFTLGHISIDRFINFCAKLQGSAPKEVVLRFFGKDQLSGHIKNFYYASYQFLNKNRNLVKPMAKISPNDFRLQNTPYLNIWKRFIKSANIKDIPSVGFYAQSTLRYLPIKLGGRQTTGGAGIGNLNRVLPLVARFIVDNQ